MKMQKALLAAGCFWGVQYYFDRVPGIVKTVVGYSGGHTTNPTYDDVCTHLTGHAESVLIEFDADVINYQRLLDHFFKMHDPTLVDSDGVNHGSNYRSAIFYYTPEQHKIAIQERNKTQERLGKPVTTEISSAGKFYEAEAYHQKFTERTGLGMCKVPPKS